MRFVRRSGFTWIASLALPLAFVQSAGLFPRALAQETGPQAARAAGEIQTPPITPAVRAMLARASELLQNNDVAAARLIFKRLANANVAEAAFELAQTYDPDFLKTIPVAGLQPDPTMARQWYERAAALGNAAAASRLSSLSAR